MMKSLLDYSSLVSAVKGQSICTVPEKTLIFTSVATDSRNVVKDTLFVPLVGEKQDGHIYIPMAIEKGASIVFVNRLFFENHADIIAEYSNKVAVIVVENTLHGLQDAAEAYVNQFPQLIKVGITGSSGKTTTKELCVSILSQKYTVVSTVGNLNSETGLPLSVFKIQPSDEVGIFELGMNRENEIGEIAKVLKPEYAVITNIGNAHIGILGSRQNIAKEKRKICTYISEKGTAFIPAHDDFASYLADGVRGNVVFYGKSLSDAGVVFLHDDGIEGTSFSIDGIPVQLKLPGKYNFNNALAAIELGKVLGLSAEQIKKGIEALRPMSGRSEIIHMQVTNAEEQLCEITVLKDCYNANPDSMQKALELSTTVGGRRIYILGDMLELGSLLLYRIVYEIVILSILLDLK